MDAWIYDAHGRSSYLPVLLEWDVSHGFCSPCDCFAVRFLYVPEMLEPLRAACRFRAVYERDCVFYGVVDELEPEKNRVRVVVSMFGRENPVDLELDQVEVIKD